MNYFIMRKDEEKTIITMRQSVPISVLYIDNKNDTTIVTFIMNYRDCSKQRQDHLQKQCK